jgi:hypothetical protein
MYINGLINSGITGAAITAIGLGSSIIAIPLFLAPAVGTVIYEACKTLKEKKKNASIVNGDYFEGKSEQEIVREANSDFVNYHNNIVGLSERFSVGENNGRSR